MENYLDLLIEQFRQATGTKNVDMNSLAFISEFSDWLKSRQEIGDKYLKLLEYMGLSKFKTPDTAEVGKGQYDSLVKPFDTKIVTLHTKGLETLGSRRVVKSNFEIYDGMPLLVRKNELFKADDVAQTFMTQNPFTHASISNWDQLHNSGMYSIIVGFFGSIYDKDKSKKEEQLRNLRYKLERDFIEQQFIDGDKYGFVVASNAKIKRLEKTR